MKNLITFLFYCLSITAVIGQGDNVTRLTLVSNEKTETLLQLDLNGIDRHAVRTPRGEAVTISMDGGTPLLEAGAPDLPKYAVSLMIPETGNMAVEITGGEYQDFPGVEVAPSKGNLKRNVDPDEVPYAYSRLYDQDAFYPQQLTALQSPYIWRDVRGQALWIQPVQYNPVTKVLRVYTQLNLRVYAAGGQGENECQPKPSRPISRTFRQLYEKTFFNFDPRFLGLMGLNQRGGQQEAPEKMLILAKDEFIDDIESFVAWKRQSGIHTTVIPLSNAGGPFDWSVFNFIKQYYEANDITYLLIVGDETALNAQMRPSDGNNYACENCYGYMEGDDHLPEILVGRFHAANRAQLKIMLQRNLEYEKNPLVDPAKNWLATAMASASNEGKGIGDDNQADYEQGNEWKSKHLADGYEKCWEFYDGSHGDISPTPGDITADQNGDPINIALVNLINGRGISLYNYTGHGWDQGLTSGNFNTDAVGQLRNKGRYPVVISVACCAGNFTNNNGGDCLGEAMQRAGDAASGEPWGMVMSYCSSDFQSWSPPMEGQDGMNQYLLDADGLSLNPVAGAMAAYGSARMIGTYAKNGETMADFWIPFGEPSLVPRTRLPQTLTASHVTNAYIGLNSLTVYASTEGALVGLYWQDQTLAVGIIENGSVNLQFPSLSTIGDLVVTVTQFNHLPYQGRVNITPASGPYLVNQPIVLDDRIGGNNNQKADYGETIQLDLTLSNVGLALAHAAQATLSSTDAEITLLDATEAFGEVAKGATVKKSAAFAFQVNSKVTDGKVVNFLVRIEYDDSLFYETTLPVRLQAPRLVVGNFIIDDMVGGNGNGRMESGETVRILVDTRNLGSAQSPDVIGRLSVDSPWLTTGTQFMLGKMLPQATATAAFAVKVLPNAPKVIPVHFTYTATGTPYNESGVFGPYTVNPIVEAFETQNFRTYPWVMGGSKPWLITTTSPFEGAYCARSGTISHNQQSQLNLTLDVITNGVVAFARRVNCEQDFDYLRFFIDDSLQGEWTGNLGWGIVSFPITEGKHRLTWSYEKDGIGSYGQDRAWIDEIALPPHEIIVAAPIPTDGHFTVDMTPNPTTGLLKLKLALPSDEAIAIDVFDQTGRKVLNGLTLVSQPAGYYEKTLDLTPLTTGVYFVQVQMAGRVMVKKVVKVGI